VRRSARLVLAAGLLAGLALPAALPAALSGSAAAATGRAGTGQAQEVTGSPVSVAITSVNPPYATAGHPVTVRGSLTNTSSAPLAGLKIELRSSSTPLSSRDQLQQYADGTDLTADAPEPHAVAVITGTVPPGATRTWTAVLPVHEVHLTAFGVYPLAAQATSAAGPALGISRTFLPFWPAARKARPAPDDIAWIWPLIDAPDQGPCGGLLNNHLAASLAGSGRLSRLLSAGSAPAGRAADLTWALDPALLSSVATMTRPYSVGANDSCRQARSLPASAVAAAWLGGLRSASSRQPAFVIPYADVDVAALTRSKNLNGDVDRAFTDGRSVATAILRRSFAPSAHQDAAGLTSSTAWPAAGLANYTTLENLAALDQIRTVVLSSSAMPPLVPTSYTPSAVTATPDGEGGDMRVLLADSTLTQLLGSVTARTATPGAAFSVRQRFLAETAMIAAEAKHLPRAIVVAPPRRWNPPSGLASGLLADTVSAPWLSPVSAGSLAADTHATGQVKRHAPDNVGTRLVSRSLLRAVQAADRGAQLVQSIQVTPNPQVYRAIAGIESAGWRGTSAGRRRARAMLRRVTDYVSKQENGVSIIGPGPVTLGGQKGAIPIPIDNRLPYAIKVRVRLSVNQAAGGGFAVLSNSGVVSVKSNVFTTKVLEIPKNIISVTKLSVRTAAIGSTTISLKLLAPDGQALPKAPVTMTVQATHFGTLGLAVLAAALGVFVIASALRAIRRGRTPPDTAQEDPADHDAPTATDAGGHEQADGTDNVVHDRAESGEAGTDHVLTEDADDYAPVPGWADRS
jgi:hypothetical protein